jgi:replicative DNA helicase
MSIANIYDSQSEAGIIATLINNPAFILHTEYLKPSHFYNQENSCIYWAIGELYKSGVSNIDSFNLTTMVNSNSGIQKTMEKFNITSIHDFVDMSKFVSRSTIEEYKILVQKVVTHAFKRDLYKRLEKFKGMCLDDSNDLGKLNTAVYDDLNKLSQEYIVSNDIELFGEKVDKLWLQTKQKQLGGALYGIPSKFEELNKYCPFEKGELIIVAAPRKKGKSIYMMNEAVHKLKSNVPTLYVDTELSSELFMQRMLAHLTSIPFYKIKSGGYDQNEEAVLIDALNWIKSKPFVHEYNPNWTNDKLYATCKILEYKMGLQFVIYDYLKTSSATTSDAYMDLGNKTNFLKNDIAGGLGMGVLAGAQLNRNHEIGDSYRIEQYTSSLINLIDKTPEEMMTDGKACGNYKLFVKLNRNGEQMSDPESEYIDVQFDGNICTFRQATQHSKLDLPI